MTRPPSTLVAMSTPEMEAELKSIFKCWEALTPLDSKGRARVVEWLSSWSRQERHDDF